MSTYLWIDLGAVLLPLLFTFHPRLRFHERWRVFWPALALMMALFLPWDIAFTARGVWSFAPEHCCGLRVLGLPVEEWLFFLCVPYACVFTYHAFQALGVKDHFGRAATGISVALVLLGLAVGLTHMDRAYTSTAFLALAAWTAFAAFVLKAPWLGRFYFTYLVLQVPFLIVNGLLTGTGLHTPVVRYNDADQLGLRLGTIPVEDTFYGLVMVGLTVMFYELLSARRSTGTGLPVPQ
ncbi:MAG: lycopene cyclase domain-containing protein [Flavobacteriales bacterium]